MAVANFPHSHRPRNWDGVRFQDHIKRIMQTWLRTGTFPNFIFAQGSSGSGKTCTCSLLIQTTHCLNRKPGEIDACGKCQVCKLDPQLSANYANIIWVNAGTAKGTDGEDITYQQAIKDALALSERGPVETGHKHRDILFVVFEEAHLMPTDLFQRCLAKADSQNPFATDVVFVFITMSPEAIKESARQAVSQRGAILDFLAPTTEELQDYLRERFRELTIESSYLIALAAGNSVRGALSAYKTCRDFQESITTSSIAQVLRFLDDKERFELWQMLKAKSKPVYFSAKCESFLKKTTGANLAKLLLQDLFNSYDILGEELWLVASCLLSEYLKNPSTLNLTYTLLNLRALNWPDSFPPEITEVLNIYAEALAKPWPSLSD